MSTSAPLSGQYVVIAAPEEVDMSNADELRARVIAGLDEQRGAVIVDMSQTTFCDSTGLGALLGAQSRADETGLQLRVLAAHRTVLKVLRVTGLDTIFTVRASLDEAVRDLGRQDPEQSARQR